MTEELTLDSLKNCCNHQIDITLPSGQVMSIQTSNAAVRLVTEDNERCHIGGIPVAQRVYYHSALLPPEKPGTLYIVPKQVAFLYAGIRDDFVYPDTRSATKWDKTTNRPRDVRQLRFPPKLLR